MALWSRIRHLITADAHGVVDALEDEALVLRQCVREAEAELERKRARLTALVAEQKRLAGEAEGLDGQMAGLDADVELALAEGEQELARFTLRRLLPLRRARAACEARAVELERERAELDETVAGQSEALADLKTRVRERLTRLESGAEGPTGAPGPVADEEIELELLRRRRQAGKVEAAGSEGGAR